MAIVPQCKQKHTQRARPDKHLRGTTGTKCALRFPIVVPDNNRRICLACLALGLEPDAILAVQRLGAGFGRAYSADVLRSGLCANANAKDRCKYESDAHTVPSGRLNIKALSRVTEKSYQADLTKRYLTDDSSSGSAAAAA